MPQELITAINWYFEIEGVLGMVGQILTALGWIFVVFNGIVAVVFIPVTILLFINIVKELREGKFHSKRQFRSVCIKSAIWPLVLYWRIFAYFGNKTASYGSGVTKYIGSTTSIYKSLDQRDDDDLSGAVTKVSKDYDGGELTRV